MAKPYFVTTAISYPNGRPHIGHAYEAIATDVIARFQRLAGRDVYFMTGTDEHGLKMAQTARGLNREPRDLADEISSYFKEMDEELDVSFDRFIRTTEPAHYAAAQALWRAMAASGDVYLGRYEGWYSVRDEAFYDEKELIDGEGGARLSPQGTPVEWTVEESWFFRLSAYQDRLLELYERQPDFVRPESRRNEVTSFVRGGLSDLSISRTSFDWGVPVPGSLGHVMYVWVDALANYLTGAGYPENPMLWPADLHVIGKDIVRFHAVYWPAFLLAAGIELPHQVFAHGFLLNRGEKMSKSIGNVVDPLDLARAFGVDALRYFLLREVPFGQDGSYSAEAIVTRTNADLANSFGNLVQRVLSMIARNLDGNLPMAGDALDDRALIDRVRATCRVEVPRAFSDLAFSQGIESWMQAVFASNQYVDAQAPWALRKTDPERMKAVLGTLFCCLRDLTIAISPVIPTSACKLLDALGIEPASRDLAALTDDGWYERLRQSGFTLAPPSPIFPRLEPVEAA